MPRPRRRPMNRLNRQPATTMRRNKTTSTSRLSISSRSHSALLLAWTRKRSQSHSTYRCCTRHSTYSERRWIFRYAGTSTRSKNIPESDIQYIWDPSQPQRGLVNENSLCLRSRSNHLREPQKDSFLFCFLITHTSVGGFLLSLRFYPHRYTRHVRSCISGASLLSMYVGRLS
jgi:hypothetical protein